jgi:hypothetical protein
MGAPSAAGAEARAVATSAISPGIKIIHLNIEGPCGEVAT